MSFRTIALLVLALIAAAAGWHYRNANWVRSLMGTTAPVKAKPVVFDNGSVRTPPPPASGSTAPAPAALGLRKCVRGSSVSYTDQPCPPGSKEQSVNKGVVTVVPGQAPAAPPANPLAGARLPNARDAMRPEGPTLNELAIERATR